MARLRRSAFGSFPERYISVDQLFGSFINEPALNAVTNLWTSVQLDGAIYAEPLVIGNLFGPDHQQVEGKAANPCAGAGSLGRPACETHLEPRRLLARLL